MLVRRPWSFSIEQKRFFSGEKRDHMEAVKKQQRWWKHHEMGENHLSHLIISYHISSHLIIFIIFWWELSRCFNHGWSKDPMAGWSPIAMMEMSSRQRESNNPIFDRSFKQRFLAHVFFCYTELYPIHFVHVIHLQSKHGLGKSPALSIAFFDPGNTWQYSSSIVRFPNCETTLVHLALAQVATLDQWLLMILLLLHDGWFLILAVDDCCQRFFGSWSLNIFDWWLDMIGVSRLSMW